MQIPNQTIAVETKSTYNARTTARLPVPNLIKSLATKPVANQGVNVNEDISDIAVIAYLKTDATVEVHPLQLVSIV